MFFCTFLRRDKGVDDKAKQKKKIKEKKTTKSKAKEGEDDGGGWTEVKGSYLSAAVCTCGMVKCVRVIFDTLLKRKGKEDKILWKKKI